MSTVKAEQLGMNPSTASHKLVKDILFQLVQETGKDWCFQCGAKIERNNFSIEHKVPWLHSDDPKALFFDLDNIAFSHKECNSLAARPSKPKPAVHNVSRYKKHGCRCEVCVKAHSEYQNEFRRVNGRADTRKSK